MLTEIPTILLYKDGAVEEYLETPDSRSILNITKTGEYSVTVEVVFHTGAVLPG